MHTGSAYKHYRSSTPGAVPAASDVAVGEIAINLADRKLYTKDAAGKILTIGGDTYTKEASDGKFLLQGVVPLSRFGDLTTADLPIKESGLTLTVTAAIPLLLAGRVYSMPVGSTVQLLPSAPTFVYVTVANSTAIFKTSPTRIPEATAMMFIGVVFSGSSSIIKNNISKVSRLDLYRPSLAVQGSAFAVSSGTPLDTTGRIW